MLTGMHNCSANLRKYTSSATWLLPRKMRPSKASLTSERVSDNKHAGLSHLNPPTSETPYIGSPLLYSDQADVQLMLLLKTFMILHQIPILSSIMCKEVTEVSLKKLAFSQDEGVVSHVSPHAQLRSWMVISRLLVHPRGAHMRPTDAEVLCNQIVFNLWKPNRCFSEM